MISAKSLFHFTSNPDTLKAILETREFQLNYCLETMSQLRDIEAYFPIVCFCDIRLSQIGNHMKTYGGYGIAMNKSWGIKQNVNPVSYLNPNSVQSRIIVDQIRNGNSREKEAALILAAMSKPYKGRMYRHNINGYIEAVKFYDEREWRYFPFKVIGTSIRHSIQKNVDFNYEEMILPLNSIVKSSEFSLKFTVKDINYIIVPTESDKVSLFEITKGVNIYLWSDLEDDI